MTAKSDKKDTNANVIHLDCPDMGTDLVSAGDRKGWRGKVDVRRPSAK